MICIECNKKVNKIENILIDSFGVYCDVECHGKKIHMLISHFDYGSIDDLKINFNTDIECKLS